MTRFTLIAASIALALTATVSPAVAQQQPAKPVVAADTAARADTARGSIRSAAAAADSAAIELARAATVLAANVEKVVKETANDPAVRLAAIEAAGQAVALAQSTVTEHLGEIEKALAEASRALADLAAKQKARTPAPVSPSTAPTASSTTPATP